MRMARFERTALAVVAALLVWQILVPPVAGLGNNGDFGKVTGVFDLGAPRNAEFHWCAGTYSFDPQNHWWAGFYSSEILIAGVAVGFNTLFSKTGTFDIRWMGVVHGGLFFLSICLLLPLLRGLPTWKRALIAVLIVLIGCDAATTTLFNSFYMDAGALVLFCLTWTFLLRYLRWAKPADLGFFTLCSVLFVCSKAQHAILGLPFAALGVYAGIRSGCRFKLGLASTVILVAAVFSSQAVPYFYTPAGVYNMIFWTLLPSSKDVSRDLAGLGLDDSYRQYSRTHTYTPDGPMQDPKFVREFSLRASYFRLGWFFVTHPERSFAILRAAVDEGARQRMTIGNFDPQSGSPRDSESRSFALWSGWKRIAFYHRPSLYLWYFVTLEAAVVGLSLGSRALIPALALGVMALLELLVAGLADPLDPIRHFLLFNTNLDLLLAGVVALIPVKRSLPADSRTSALAQAA